MILSFVVRTTSMIDFDVSVTLVGDFTICARLKHKQKSVKARPSGPFPRTSQFRSPSNTTVMPCSRDSTTVLVKSSRKLIRASGGLYTVHNKKDLNKIQLNHSALGQNYEKC